MGLLCDAKRERSQACGVSRLIVARVAVVIIVTVIVAVVVVVAGVVVVVVAVVTWGSVGALCA